MRLNRRAACRLMLATAAWAPGCRSREDPLGVRVDRALDEAMGALVAAQSPDGAWRSRTYGALKDGPSLTPPVLKAITFGPGVAGSDPARARGAAYLVELARRVRSVGAPSAPLIYPVYTASASAIVLGRLQVEGGREARDAWLLELRRRQMTEALGWDRSDAAFGSWGYALAPLEKPAGLRPDQPLDADLSSTLFAVSALRLAGAGADDPAVVAARAFVGRCQNLGEEGQGGDPAFDDGGFFFTPTDPVRNKAGEAGRDRRGRVRFHSYGGATADGVRALLRCGLGTGHPRVVAARGWLERQFAAGTNPGAFEPGRELDRDATFYYYAWSVAHAFRALGVVEIGRGGRRVAWAEDLARELLGRRRQDGTWSNPVSSSKEDDPLIATSLAAGALGLCRAAIPR